MRCELCTRKLGRSELVHAIRYGTVDDASDMFVPLRESAATVVCQQCGEVILRQIYSKLSKLCLPVRPSYQ